MSIHTYFLSLKRTLFLKSNQQCVPALTSAEEETKQAGCWQGSRLAEGTQLLTQDKAAASFPSPQHSLQCWHWGPQAVRSLTARDGYMSEPSAFHPGEGCSPCFCEQTTTSPDTCFLFSKNEVHVNDREIPFEY